MPEQERRPASNATKRRAANGGELPIRAGTPRIRLDGLPATLRWAIWIISAQAVGMLVVAGILGYDAATGPAQSVTSAVATVAFAVLMGVVLGWLAFALTRRRAWARGPAVVLQLLLLPIGGSIVTAGPAIVGVLVIVIGLAGAATLLAPATRAALELR